ncbi:Major Facilitator Superfamily protein [Frankineae bacterium MT45]|nr:Major Facilitator Superfamily protein [Frankineae bacterium MT45]
MLQVATPPAAPVDGYRSRLALSVCLIAVFMQMLDVTGVNIALPAIGSGLHAPARSLQLIPIAYTLTFACSLLTAARIGDRHGRRRVFLIGLTAFAATSAACGCVNHLSELVALRFLQGASGALMAAQTVALIATTFAPATRTAAFAIYGATAGIASIIGPNVGAALLSLNLAGWGWRLIFFINVPFALVALVLGRSCLPESRVRPRPRPDVAGAALCGCGLFLLVGALSIGTSLGWGTYSLAALLIAPLVLACFVSHEARLDGRGGDPLLRVALLRRPSFGWGSLLALLVYGVFTGLVFTLSLTLQLGIGLTPTQGAVMSLPLALGAMGFAALSPRLFRRFDSWLLVAGALALGVALLATAMLIPGAGGWRSLLLLWPALLLAGAGVGVFIAPLPVTVIRDVAPSDLGSASGALPTMQQVGCSIGFAVAAMLYFGRLGRSPRGASEYLQAQQLVLLLLAGAAIGAALVATRIPRQASPSEQLSL